MAEAHHETVYKPLYLCFKMLTQESMIGKCEDVEAKNSCWAKKLVTIYNSST